MAFEALSEGDTSTYSLRSEATGALGDSITVLPIVVALAATTHASLPHVLLAFGLFQVVWGVRYGLPISVEPMKALAGLAIAGTLTYPELVGAGLLAGLILLVLGAAGVLDRVADRVGVPVIRGVQLAVALLLAKTGVELAVATPEIAALGVVVTLAVAAVGYRRASALVVLAVGVGMAVLAAGVPTPTLPALALFPAGRPAFTTGAVEGALAQLAMSVGNAAVATSLLCADLFDADVSPDELSTSMGAMTLLSAPIGGIPMCHGSGGLAGKYAFGARTGVANVVLGALYALAALVAGGALVLAFPTALLGVLLVVVAVQLGRSAADTDDRLLTAGVGLLGLLTNVGVAFLLGAAVYLVRERVRG